MEFAVAGKGPPDVEASGSGTQGGTPPGWYDDPWAPGTLRWWDGTEWTGHTTMPHAPHPPPASPAPVSSQGRVWPWVAAAATVAVVAIGIGLFVAIRAAVFGEDSSGPRTTSPKQPVAPPAAQRYQPPQSNRLPEVALGGSVDVTTQDRVRVRVTALAVVDPVPRGGYLLRPKRGRRWVGVRLRVEALGPGVYKDAPGNGSRLLAGAQSYRAVTAQPDGCPPLEVLLKLAPGQSATGCLIFEIPRGRSVGRFRFVPSSGFAPDVATWRLPPGP